MNIEKIQINSKPRKLNAKWTVTLEHGETEISEELSRQIQEEIDFEVMCDMLGRLGWVKIKMKWPERMNESKAHDIKEWCRANLQNAFHGRGSIWMFSNEKDAVMFSLKWS